MAKTNLMIKQFRFYGFGNEKNEPSIEREWFYGAPTTGTEERKHLLTDYGAVLKLGIQGLPGTTFHLNDNIGDSIMLDHTGIYELDLTDTTTAIRTLYFDWESLSTINRVNNTPLIVDILCYEKDSE